MHAQHKIAGIFMSVGIFGLAISQLAVSPASIEKGGDHAVSVAISSGPQLLLSEKASTPPSTARRTSGAAMVCASVYRLSFADIGLNCRRATSQQELAAITR